jgi:hypothetical protein
VSLHRDCFPDGTDCHAGCGVATGIVLQVRKKPVEVQAMRYDGGVEDAAIIRAWVNGASRIEWFRDGKMGLVTLETAEGHNHLASPGDFIIKGVKGEFYPCKPDIFWATYDVVGEAQSNQEVPK